MTRPATAVRLLGGRRPLGYTLMEILVATALTLMLMAGVATMFGQMGNSINQSRAVLEMAERLRACAALLQSDLAGHTVTPLPPRRPESGEGYLEIIEGPVGPDNWDLAVNNDAGMVGLRDTSVGDVDDMLIFTTRSTSRPFVGRVYIKRAPLSSETPTDSDGAGPYVLVNSTESDVAEIAWFMRGRTLYRRVLLVRPLPDVDLRTNNLDVPSVQGFYGRFDISARPAYDGTSHVAYNTLSDLTKRECRYAHRYNTSGGSANSFPFDVRSWGILGLPTLRECSHGNWSVGVTTIPSLTVPNPYTFDFWSQQPFGWSSDLDRTTGTILEYDGPRKADDIVLTNVIGFDVKVWEPAKAQYVDLGYEKSLPTASPTVAGSVFYHIGYPKSQLQPSDAAGDARVYDTWSFHYEHDGEPQPASATTMDLGTNGFDDDSNGIVDDVNEWETMPPYPVPLRGIQVKIRVYEPSSRQIREVSIVQDFLPK